MIKYAEAEDNAFPRLEESGDRIITSNLFSSCDLAEIDFDLVLLIVVRELLKVPFMKDSNELPQDARETVVTRRYTTKNNITFDYLQKFCRLLESVVIVEVLWCCGEL